MSQYIQEIVLQEFIIENIDKLDLSIKYLNTYHELVEARFNKTGTFWDLEGKLDNGNWIPVEVEWISDNFLKHRHDKSSDFPKFLKGRGVVITLCKNREIEKVYQVSILENIPQNKFEKLFNNWLKTKLTEYSSKTLKNFFIGNYKRTIPRILIIPISKNARNNYFSKEPLYYKKESDPLMIGFKEAGFKNNEFVRDIQEGDICIFLDSDGNRTTRPVFINNVKKGNINIHRLTAFKIESSLFQITKNGYNIDNYYWPDEIKEQRTIYLHRCILSEKPFIDYRDKIFPFVKKFTEDGYSGDIVPVFPAI